MTHKQRARHTHTHTRHGRLSDLTTPERQWFDISRYEHNALTAIKTTT